MIYDYESENDFMICMLGEKPSWKFIDAHEFHKIFVSMCEKGIEGLL